jgi:isopentenyl diphosphate isomerase/L-lactate dehydrogenase-like FMN-dependent dehydrogenase
MATMTFLPQRLHHLNALRDEARRRLPRFVFDFIDGAAHGEVGLALNRAAFDAVRLLPRVLSSSDERESGVILFGRRYAAPFGIAPIGMANAVAPGTDIALATAAAAANIPYALSTAGTTSIEAITEAAPGSWFQLYVGKDEAVVDGLIARADAAGCPVLIVTADVPAPGKRRRDLVNGFRLPFKPSLGIAAGVLAHPGWGWKMATGGTPRFANLARYAAPKASKGALAHFMAGQSSARLDWDLLRAIRARWSRPMLLKGVLHPDDAVMARNIGVDGVIVSNHGARQLDAALAPIAALPGIRAALGEGVPVLLDGGVRTGEDVARALILGADMVLLGRPFVFSVAVMGAAGPAWAIETLADEFDRALAHLGCKAASDLDSSLLARV